MVPAHVFSMFTESWKVMGAIRRLVTFHVHKSWHYCFAGCFLPGRTTSLEKFLLSM